MLAAAGQCVAALAAARAAPASPAPRPRRDRAAAVAVRAAGHGFDPDPSDLNAASRTILTDCRCADGLCACAIYRVSVLNNLA